MVTDHEITSEFLLQLVMRWQTAPALRTALYIDEPTDPGDTVRILADHSANLAGFLSPLDPAAIVDSVHAVTMSQADVRSEFADDVRKFGIEALSEQHLAPMAIGVAEAMLRTMPVGGNPRLVVAEPRIVGDADWGRSLHDADSGLCCAMECFYVHIHDTWLLRGRVVYAWCLPLYRLTPLDRELLGILNEARAHWVRRLAEVQQQRLAG